MCLRWTLSDQQGHATSMSSLSIEEMLVGGHATRSATFLARRVSFSHDDSFPRPERRRSFVVDFLAMDSDLHDQQRLQRTQSDGLHPFSSLVTTCTSTESAIEDRQRSPPRADSIDVRRHRIVSSNHSSIESIERQRSTNSRRKKHSTSRRTELVVPHATNGDSLRCGLCQQSASPLRIDLVL